MNSLRKKTHEQRGVAARDRNRQPRSLFVSEALVAPAVEGGQVLAAEIAAHLRREHDAAIVGPAGTPLADVAGLLVGRFLGRRALDHARRLHPQAVIYQPANGLTPATLLRAMLLWLAAHRPSLELIVLQDHLTNHAVVARFIPRQWTFLATTPEQAAVFRAHHLEYRLLQPRIPAAKTSSIADRDVARRALGLPDGAIYLHVGHARAGRNLSALAPLAAFGSVVIVLSGYGEEDPGSVPEGNGITVLRGYLPALADYYRAASAYVFPTFDAGAVIGTPMSVFEALLNGTPVVARRSTALQRWESLPGLVLVDSDEEMLEQLRDPALLPVPERSAFLQPQECGSDFAVCSPVTVASSMTGLEAHEDHRH